VSPSRISDTTRLFASHSRRGTLVQLKTDDEQKEKGKRKGKETIMHASALADIVFESVFYYETNFMRD